MTTPREASHAPAARSSSAALVVAGDRSDLVRVWNVIAEGVGTARPPSTLLGVAMLGYPEQLVEIEAVALAGASIDPPPVG